MLFKAPPSYRNPDEAYEKMNNDYKILQEAKNLLAVAGSGLWRLAQDCETHELNEELMNLHGHFEDDLQGLIHDLSNEVSARMDLIR
ncbi:hypothetical protein GWO43_30335 [candidate division KSB1 bacterium]|nr:hypothetical protein [candidate division KSB1 bacterium]NIV70656.1 hypothetical protein [Phycisphaerae bacterium]NIS28187.1 hypothetical protein [candidate division KSB1 bacterium]NIT75081.1 hypothetical protein [candidate division KSB1 bacterium]NIU28866.1 hypothetical protein [candidate division KSB1 bacterium]